MEIGWFFLWLGLALAGLGLLLLRTWWRERRFEGAALTLSAGLLLLGAAVQQFILVGMAESDGRAVDSPAFITVSIVSAAFATAVWIALATKRGRESLRRGAERPRRIRELEVLGAIARLASQPGSVEEIGGAILEAAAPAVGADAAVLLLYDPERRVLSAEAASGIPDESWRSFAFEVSDDFNQTLLASGRPLVVRDVAGERRLKMQLARSLGARSALVVPIRHEGDAVGTLTFYAVRAPRRFDAVALAVAELIANEAGDVLQRIRLQAEVREERERAARVLAHVGDGVFFVDGGGRRAALEPRGRGDHRPRGGAGPGPAARGRPPGLDGDRAARARCERADLRGQARRDAAPRPRRQGGLDLDLGGAVPRRHGLRAARPDRGAGHREAEERVRRHGLPRAPDPARRRIRRRDDPAPAGRRARRRAPRAPARGDRR